jgi:hypothetical protein
MARLLAWNTSLEGHRVFFVILLYGQGYRQLIVSLDSPSAIKVRQNMPYPSSSQDLSSLSHSISYHILSISNPHDIITFFLFYNAIHQTNAPSVPHCSLCARQAC